MQGLAFAAPVAPSIHSIGHAPDLARLRLLAFACPTAPDGICESLPTRLCHAETISHPDEDAASLAPPRHPLCRLLLRFLCPLAPIQFFRDASSDFRMPRDSLCGSRSLRPATRSLGAGRLAVRRRQALDGGFDRIGESPGGTRALMCIAPLTCRAFDHHMCHRLRRVRDVTNFFSRMPQRSTCGCPFEACV